MKNRFFALFIACAFILNAVGFVSADTKSNKKQINPLLALLPASDGVVSVDAKRFFGTALPQILSGNKEMLDEINGKVDEFKSNTGIDIRQFEQVAIGVACTQVSPTDTDFEPVALARGNFNADSLVKLAKYASSNNYREEKIGSRTVYIFSPKEMIEKNKTTVKNPSIQKMLDHLLPRLSGETAITAYDGNTLAFGKLERLRLMFTESKSRVDANLLAQVNRHPNAVMSFAMNLLNGLSPFMKLEDDDLGRNLASIRQISGMTDIVGENTSVLVAVKTAKPENAESMKTSFTGLQAIFSDMLINSKRENQKTYGRMLKNAKFSRTGSELTIDLQIAQSDLNTLIGAK